MSADPIPLFDPTEAEVTGAEMEGENVRVRLRDPATDGFSYLITPSAKITISIYEGHLMTPVEVEEMITGYLKHGLAFRMTNVEFADDGTVLKAHFERT